MCVCMCACASVSCGQCAVGAECGGRCEGRFHQPRDEKKSGDCQGMK